MDIDLSKMQFNLFTVSIILLCVFISIINLFILSYGWKILLECFSNDTIQYNKVWRIYLNTNVAKYIPGNFMHYIERNILAKDLGIRQFFLAVTSFLEYGILIINAIFLTFLFSAKHIAYILNNFLSYKTIILLLFCLIVTVFFLFIGIRKSEKILDILYSLKKEVNIKRIKYAILKIFIIYTMFHILNGICFAMISKYIILREIQNDQFVFLVVSYIIAWVIGFCVPGAPGGMGIREIILIMLAGNVLGNENIYVIVVIQRFVSTIGDSLGFVISKLPGEIHENNI